MGNKRGAYRRLTPEEKQQLNTELLPERDNVQVYKDAFDLLVFVYNSSRNVNREYRYTLFEEMKHTLQNMMTAIYEARKTTPRSLLLVEALHYCYEAKVLYRVMDELHLLKDWHCAMYIRQLASISKQLTAWQKYERRKEKESNE